MCLCEIMFFPQFLNKKNIKNLDSIILFLHYANKLEAIVGNIIVIYYHQIII